MKEIPEPVTEESIPEEPIPEESITEESEPPIKEPEPEVMLTASTEKSVLSFVDEDLSAKHYVKRYITEEDYRQWFDTNYSEYEFWEGIGITQETFDKLTVEIEFEPEPKIIQTGFVLVPDNEETENEEKTDDGRKIYRAYVLVEYDEGAAQKRLLAQIKADEQLFIAMQATKLYDEMEEQVEAYRQRNKE